MIIFFAQLETHKLNFFFSSRNFNFSKRKSNLLFSNNVHVIVQLISLVLEDITRPKEQYFKMDDWAGHHQDVYYMYSTPEDESSWTGITNTSRQPKLKSALY